MSLGAHSDSSKIIDMPANFLHEDPDTWTSNEEYLAVLNVVKNLKVLNDGAERGVKLMSDYNKLITKNESDKQCLLRGVSKSKLC